MVKTQRPPGLNSQSENRLVNPSGPHHRARRSGSRNAAKISSAVAGISRDALTGFMPSFYLVVSPFAANLKWGGRSTHLRRTPMVTTNCVELTGHGNCTVPLSGNSLKELQANVFKHG